jgi:hypothetical protein
MKVRLKSLKQQKLDGELGLIIDEFGRAMWNANKEYIAQSYSVVPLTLSMHAALSKFQDYCQKYYGKK